MMGLIKKTTYILLLSLAVFATGCEDDATRLEPPQLNDGSGDVTLSLRVSVGNSVGIGTRADDEQGFKTEKTEDKYEKIHSLRVIIVRQDSTVEFNRLITQPEGVSVDQISDLDFKVSTSLGTPVLNEQDGKYYRTEKKHIYLIANEESIPESSVTTEGYNIKKLLEELKPGLYKKVDSGNGSSNKQEYVPGDLFTSAVAKNLMIWNDWESASGSGSATEMLPKYAKPIINNDGEKKEYVLMTEFFDIDVSFNVTDVLKEQQQKENLFITRNLVKFRFSIDAKEGTQPFKVKKVKFSNLMQKEYFFPRCEYNPPKNNRTAEIINREIVSYETPSKDLKDGNLIRPYEFEPANFAYNTYNKGTKGIYEPLLYFCESTNFVGDDQNKPVFDISLEVAFQEESEEGTITEIPVNFDAKGLTALRYGLPRNTIVQVNMTLANRKINATVTLVPYIGVTLEPTFGFEELISNQKKDEQDNENND